MKAERDIAIDQVVRISISVSGEPGGEGLKEEGGPGGESEGSWGKSEALRDRRQMSVRGRGGKQISVEEGTTLLDAIVQSGMRIRASCGGKGTCGKCRVYASGELSPVTSREEAFLSPGELAAGLRLACQARALGDVDIRIPSETQITRAQILTAGVVGDGREEQGQGHGHALQVDPLVRKVYLELDLPSLDDTDADFERLERKVAATPRLRVPRVSAGLDVIRRMPFIIQEADYKVTAVLNSLEAEAPATATVMATILALEPGDTTDRCYGVAFDIGTTTVAGFLMDLVTGREVGVASRMNAQAAYGDDVISRIGFARDNPDGTDRLQEKIIGVLNSIIDDLTRDSGIEKDNIYLMTVVGNTCMHHLFLGVNPGQLGVSPYVPVIKSLLAVPARDLGISINPTAPVVVLPNIGGFVGADTVGVILATSLYRGDELRLAIDLGTNGEMALGSRERIVACSTAAGPAFEGSRISQGMPAMTGAIEWVEINDDVEVRVVGGPGTPARGICGSGLLDAVAGLLRLGIIEETGRMLRPLECEELTGRRLPPAIARRVREGRRGLEFVLIEDFADDLADDHKAGGAGGSVVLTQRDIREFQLAKGAIFAGTQILKGIMGVEDKDISEVLLAGAFGNYLRKESARAVGLIPQIPLERVRGVGNAAGTGAKMALLSKAQIMAAEALAGRVEYIELGSHPRFQEEFARAMFFPRPDDHAGA
ncbi:MAG: DUF4445 domain-containing protein [Firmicutes bacterium]|nr:DUF4445 domain-containing protein [Bacillota bacterium]